MLNSNANCQVLEQTGFDIYGQPSWGVQKTERCAVVRFKPTLAHTTVRADGSMSRGHGDELIMGACRVLLDASTVAQLQSRITVLGLGFDTLHFKVLSMEPRLDVTGVIDHYAVEGEQCP